MKKLIIQIPCFNEEDMLPETLSVLPRSVPGVDVVEWLVIDDGSTDRTVAVARGNGVDHIVRLPTNRGLARAYLAGLEASLRLGAHVIVNTDADNQYEASCIPDLVAPVVAGQADIVIGERPIMAIEHFSLIKKMLQRLGSWSVALASGTTVRDAPSGFRAINRAAAMQMNVFNTYTYTLETIIQAGRKNMRIATVPVRVHGPTRPSRLVKSVGSYVRRSMLTIVRIFIIYKPLRFFVTLGALLAVPGLFFGFRFLYFLSIGQGAGHVQSLILTAILLLSGVLLSVLGILAELIATNRMLLEDIRTRLLDIDTAPDARFRVSPIAQTRSDSASDRWPTTEATGE
ncbi:MAG: glycosyltransferase family 2 protein [Gammaproteobacteria bacterium]